MAAATIEEEAISTHAPRTGSDHGAEAHRQRRGLFQPTLPARGATGWRWTYFSAAHLFQPTLPARGATVVVPDGVAQQVISTHAPRTGSDLLSGREALLDLISTHAPRTGSDYSFFNASGTLGTFQPTLPARGATRRDLPDLPSVAISTHAPRTGSDRRNRLHRPVQRISTHAPRTGSDQALNRGLFSEKEFQPTLPARGATEDGMMTDWFE